MNGVDLPEYFIAGTGILILVLNRLRELATSGTELFVSIKNLLRILAEKKRLFVGSRPGRTSYT